MEFSDQGDFQGMTIELKNALLKDESFFEGRRALGEAYILSGDGNSAAKELRLANRLRSNDTDVAISLVRAKLLQNQYEAIPDLIKKLGIPEEDTTAQILAAKAEIGLMKLEPARAKLLDLLKQSPESIEAYQALATIAWRRRDYAETEKWVTNALEIDPKNGESWLLLGEVQLVRNNYPAAVASFEKCLELEKFAKSATSIGAHAGAAKALLAENKHSEAQRHISALGRINLRNPLYNYLGAVAATQEGDNETAKTKLLSVLEVVENHYPSLLLLARIEYGDGNYNQAEQQLLRYLKVNANGLLGTKLLSAVYIKQNKPAEAIALLRPAASRFPDDLQLAVMLGSAYTMTGNNSEGTRYLEIASRLAPDDSAIRAQLAFGYLTGGGTDRAMSELEHSLKLDPDFAAAEQLLIIAQIKQGDTEKAIDTASKLAQKQPENPVPLNLIATAHLKKGDRDSAREYFAKALGVSPDFFPAKLNLAQMELDDGNIAVAKKYYEEILAINPNHSDALMKMASVLNRSGRPGDVLQYWERARQANPTAFLPRLTLAVNYTNLGRPDLALAPASEAVAINPTDLKALSILTLAQIANSQFEQATETARKHVALAPKSSNAHFNLAQISIQTGKYEEAREYLSRSLELKPNFLQAKLAVAGLELRAENADAAVKIAEDILRADPDFLKANEILVSAYLMKKDFDNALKAALKYREARPDAIEAIQLVGAVYEAQGDTDLAREAFRDAEKAQPDSYGVAMNLARMAVAAGDFAEASSRYGKYAALGDPAAAVGLATVYDLTGYPDKATSLLEETRKKIPQALEARLTLTRRYLQKGDIGQAEQIILEAKRIGPTDPAVLYLSSMILNAAGRPTEALADIEAFLVESPESIEGKFQLGQIKERLGAIDAAYQAYTDVVAVSPDHAAAKERLGFIALRKQNVDEAMEIAKQLQLQMPDNATAYLLAGDAEQIRGNRADAEQYYRKAGTLANSASATISASTALLKLELGEEAVGILDKWLSKHPKDKDVLIWRGMTAETLGRDEEATQAYEKVLKFQPDHPLVLNNLAYLYDKVGRKDALEFARRAYKIAPENPEIGDTYGWMLLRQENVALATNVLEKAVANGSTRMRPEALASIKFHLAIAYRKSGEDANAATIIRELLAQNVEFPEKDKAEVIARQLQ